MSGEQTLVTTHNQGDYGARESTRFRPYISRCALASDGICVPPNRRTIQLLLQLHLRMLAIRLLDRLDRLASAIFRGKGAFEHVGEVRWYLSKTNGGCEVKAMIWLKGTRMVLKERNKWGV